MNSNKKNVLCILLIMSVLLGSGIGTTSGLEVVVSYLSNELNVGDTFKWEVNLSGESSWNLTGDFQEYYGIFDKTTIQLELLKDTTGINFKEINLDEQYSEYFEFTIDGQLLNLSWDAEIIAFFIYPTYMEFSNGTNINPADRHWIYAINDDLWFVDQTYETNLQIITEEDNVRYEAYIYYVEDSLNWTIEAEINKNLGIMNKIDMTMQDDLSASLVTETIKFTRKGAYNAINFDFKFLLLVLPLIVVPVIIRRKKKFKT